MTEPKMPRNWPQMDPGEQWDAAVKLATAEVEKDRDEWERTTRSEERVKAEAEYSTTHEHWLNFWGIVGAIVAVSLIVWAIIGIGGCTAQSTEAGRASAAELQSWMDRCITSGGSVYRDSEKVSGMRLCVTGGKVVATHE